MLSSRGALLGALSRLAESARKRPATEHTCLDLQQVASRILGFKLPKAVAPIRGGVVRRRLRVMTNIKDR
eukprot:11588548-Alexandrium_andersonii.AAC.1